MTADVGIKEVCFSGPGYETDSQDQALANKSVITLTLAHALALANRSRILAPPESRNTHPFETAKNTRFCYHRIPNNLPIPSYEHSLLRER
jgi:hypothetical protein